MKHLLDFLIACINTNRNYIGFEISKEYCEIAEQRLADLEIQTMII